MGLRRCPYCNGNVRIIRLSGKEYYIRCEGCDMEHLDYKNPVDLKEQWNRWVKIVKDIK